MLFAWLLSHSANNYDESTMSLTICLSVDLSYHITAQGNCFKYIFIWNSNCKKSEQWTIATILKLLYFPKKVKQNKTKHEKQRTTFQEDYIFTQKKDVKTLLNNKFSTTSFYLLQAHCGHKTYNGTDGYFSRDSKSLLLNLKTTKSIYHNNRLWPLSWHDLFVPSVRFRNSH